MVLATDGAMAVVSHTHSRLRHVLVSYSTYQTSLSSLPLVFSINEIVYLLHVLVMGLGKALFDYFKSKRSKAAADV